MAQTRDTCPEFDDNTRRMPARSKAQQRLMAIAEHDPSKLYARHRGVLKMSQRQRREFAATRRTGLPAKANAPRQTHGSLLTGDGEHRRPMKVRRTY